MIAAVDAVTRHHHDERLIGVALLGLVLACLLAWAGFELIQACERAARRRRSRRYSASMRAAIVQRHHATYGGSR